MIEDIFTIPCLWLLLLLYLPDKISYVFPTAGDFSTASLQKMLEIQTLIWCSLFFANQRVFDSAKVWVHWDSCSLQSSNLGCML